VKGEDLANLLQPPEPPQRACLSAPTRADRHTRERVIAQAARHTRVEHAREPEVGADPKPDSRAEWLRARDEADGGLHVGHDADRRSLRIDAATERQGPTGTNQRRARSRAGPAPNTMAPSSGKSMVCVITRSRPSIVRRAARRAWAARCRIIAATPARRRACPSQGISPEPPCHPPRGS